jgi:hypothetical protein
MTDAQIYIGKAYLDHPTKDLDMLRTQTLALVISYIMGPTFRAPEGEPFLLRIHLESLFASTKGVRYTFEARSL